MLRIEATINCPGPLHPIVLVLVLVIVIVIEKERTVTTTKITPVRAESSEVDTWRCDHS